MSNAISIYRGDSIDLAVSVETSDNATFDLTDYEAKLTVKRTPSRPDTTAILTATGTIATPESGVIVFEVPPDDTEGLSPGLYWYDVQIVNTDTSKVHTVVKDRFTILEDVTLTGIVSP